MDLEMIFWLIVVFFFLFGRSRKKKAPKLPTGEPASEQPASQSTSFQDALREIREALAEASQQQQKEPEVVTVPRKPESSASTGVPERVIVRSPPRARSESGPSERRTPPEPRRPPQRPDEFVRPIPDRGSGKISIARRERSFSQLPEFKGDEFVDMERALVRGADHPHKPSLASLRRKAVQAKPAPGTKIAAAPGLGKEDLRRGVLLSEILGPPRALRPYSRHRGGSR